MAEVLIQPGFFLFERGGADQWTSKTSVYVRSSQGLFLGGSSSLSLSPYSQTVCYPDEVSVSGRHLVYLQLLSSPPVPTQNGLQLPTQWNGKAHEDISPFWDQCTHTYKRRRKKSLYSNDILITHCILSHSCIALHGNIYFNRITIQRRLNLTVVNILFTTFISNIMLESI